MTSFGYRLNPRYVIKECLSCGALYTRDCSCSKGSVEDKILVLKPPKNCARCARCGHPDHGVNPPHIDECCCECGEALDGIICQRCACNSCKKVPCVSKPNFVDESSNIFIPPPQPPIYSCEFCGSNAQYGHYCTPQAPFINLEPGFDQNQPPQFPVVHPPPQETSIKISYDQENVINSVQTFLRKFNRYSFFETPKVLLLAWDRVSKIKDAFKKKQNKPEDIQELFRKLLDDLQNINEDPSWNRPAVYDDDDDDVDYTIAITPVLSTEEPNNSLSMGDEHLDTILATKSDEVIKSSVENLIPIPSKFKAKDHFEIVINSNDDISYSDDDSLYYENIEYVEASPHDSELVNLLIAKIEALKDNPTPSSEFLTKSSSTSPKSVLEGTNTFHNSLPEFENIYFDLEEISSGSTTTHSDISLPEYEAFSFYDDHIKEISSGSTTTQSDIYLPEYDSFIFDLSNDQFPPTDGSDFTHEEFGDKLAHIISPSDYDCLYFRNYPDPGITINRSYSFKSGLSHRCRTFKKFNTRRSHLNESPIEMLFSTLFPKPSMGEN
nr:hypothetical protein [Tanacetum cinerariifolium]